MEIGNSQNSYSQDKSTFNMGLAILIRIDSILTHCALSSYSDDFYSWSCGLFTLSKEINYLFDKNEEEKEKEYRDVIYQLMPEWKSRMKYNNESERYEITGKDSYDNYSIFYTCLLEYEKFLRSSLHKRDMLIFSKADRKKAITEM